MKMKILGLFDQKSQSFIEMTASPNTAVAVRNLGEIVNKPSEHPVHKWPDDFSLWELGDWDSENGKPVPRLDEDGGYERKLIVHCQSLKS